MVKLGSKGAHSIVVLKSKEHQEHPLIQVSKHEPTRHTQQSQLVECMLHTH